jgi:hypothetical protein
MNPSSSYGFSRPGGDIVTLLDLTPRDDQDNELFPLASTKTWWTPDTLRRLRPFSLSLCSFPIRGPTSFGQRFTFDLGSVNAGDLLFSTVLQIQLGHWLDDTSILRLQAGTLAFGPDEDPWFYANALGSSILQRAELEIGDQTIEIVDGDFLNVSSLLFQDLNAQFGFSADGIGRSPFASQTQTPISKPFPTQNGTLFIPLPFFFQRVKLAEALPLLACKEGSVRIHITLRPFQECVRRLSGARNSCDETPLNTSIQVINKTQEVQESYAVQTSIAIPQFKSIQLLTYTAHTEGVMRQSILRSPFEILMRNVQTFTFSEPLKYQIVSSSSDSIRVQLPLEANHPMEEILWFVRRKDTETNNEWTNYSSVLAKDFNPIFNPRQPLLQKATLQLNGIDLISAEELWFRQHIALSHKGSGAAFENFVYGYSFASNPSEHQPSGTANASRLNSVRLTLDVRGDCGLWEIKVFVITLQWLRFQDGIANRMFSD